MFAIIQTGGKQYRVKPGDELEIERRDQDLSKPLKIHEVMLYSKDAALEIGRPYVRGAVCELEPLKEVKGPKVISFKYIRREKAATKIGHRQRYWKVKVKSISKTG